MLTPSAAPFVPRVTRQPGPASADRLVHLADDDARAARVALAPGQDLLTGLARAGSGSAGGVATFLSGTFARLVYCLAGPDPSGRTAATYTGWVEAGNATVLGGSASVGRALDGSVMAHCHAWFVLPAGGGLGGGHLDPARSIVGAAGLCLRATLFGRIEARQAPDPETNHAVFAPRPVGERL